MFGESFSKVSLRVAALAGILLPLIGEDPTYAYAADICTKIRPLRKFQEFTDTDVTVALKLLEQNNFVTSAKERHPDDHTGYVRLYRLTQLGAFFLSLTSRGKIL